MELFASLAQQMGLNASFFYHFCLVAVLYFVSKSWFFTPHIQNLKTREALTEGRVKNNKLLEAQILELKLRYEELAKKTHRDFQKSFQAIKQKAEEEFKAESLKLEKNHKALILIKKSELSKAILQQEQDLEKELKELLALLSEKLSAA